MKQRCHNPRSTAYEGYGAAGIAVCDKWRSSFEAFLGDMGEAPSDMSLDRIDPRGNYEPSNCRWATSLEQGRNKRTVREVFVERITVDKLVSLLAEKMGIDRDELAEAVNRCARDGASGAVLGVVDGVQRQTKAA